MSEININSKPSSLNLIQFVNHTVSLNHSSILSDSFKNIIFKACITKNIIFKPLNAGDQNFNCEPNIFETIFKKLSGYLFF
jgi:hypothetical protein